MSGYVKGIVYATSVPYFINFYLTIFIWIISVCLRNSKSGATLRSQIYTILGICHFFYLFKKVFWIIFLLYATIYCLIKNCENRGTIMAMYSPALNRTIVSQTSSQCQQHSPQLAESGKWQTKGPQESRFISNLLASSLAESCSRLLLDQDAGLGPFVRRVHLAGG